MRSLLWVIVELVEQVRALFVTGETHKHSRSHCGFQVYQDWWTACRHAGWREKGFPEFRLTRHGSYPGENFTFRAVIDEVAPG